MDEHGAAPPPAPGGPAREPSRRELVTSDAKILQVALDAGFGSLSRFNAAFRAVCGCAPREYRALHRM